MKFIIPGGTGQIGTVLARAIQKDGHEVVVLSRSPRTAPWRVVVWDAKTVGSWAKELEGADVVINLAGRSVNCRYNDENRRQIIGSRVDSTRAIGQAIAQTDSPPRLWLQSSTATIYAHRFDAANDEASGIIGGQGADIPSTWRFSIDVAKAWESAAQETPLPRTRQILLRSAMVMSPDREGVFDVLLRLVRFGLGGATGSGRQYVSWIHEKDFIRAIYWLVARESVEGVINLAAPNPLPNAQFMKKLRQSWGISFGLPAASWMVEFGALFLRTESELVLKSRRVVPGRLLDSGFIFDYPSWDDAATELCQRWRQERN